MMGSSRDIGFFDDPRTANYIMLAGLAGMGFAVLLHLTNVEKDFDSQTLMSKPRRVLLIGDSLAVGMSDPFKNLATNSIHHFSSKGCNAGSTPLSGCTSIVGASVVQWARDSWILPVLQKHQPQVVLISLGTNDFRYPAASKQKIQEQIRILVEKIRSFGAEPIWIDPVSMPFADTAGVRDSWKSTGIRYFDSSSLSYDRAPDGVHLKPLGYQDWASKIWSWLLTQ